MKLKICLLGMLCLFFRAKAQENNSHSIVSVTPLKAGLTALQIGAHVPDVLLNKVLNNGGKALHLADFRGKLLVIDFWATSCGACIQAMPRLDSVADAFKDKLVILPVTTEKSNRIIAFQRTNQFLKGKRFRTVVEDNVLSSLFPHRLLPHDVWIDTSGKVIAFTEVAAVNRLNVDRALLGKSIIAEEKVDVLDYDRHKPLLVGGNGGSDTLYRYRSVITGKLPGLPSGMGFSYDSVKHMTVVRATNVSARRLYTLVFKELAVLPDHQVDMSEVSGLYCYELDLPQKSPGLVRRSIREDLDRFFNVRSEWSGDSFRLVALVDDPHGTGEKLGL
jgi:thiol-disulfide isomerase/thioredoxin